MSDELRLKIGIFLGEMAKALGKVLSAMSDKLVTIFVFLINAYFAFQSIDRDLQTKGYVLVFFILSLIFLRIAGAKHGRKSNIRAKRSM